MSVITYPLGCFWGAFLLLGCFFVKTTLQSFWAYKIGLLKFHPTRRTVTSKQEIRHRVPQKRRSVLADVCHSFYCSWIIWSISQIWQCKLWVQLLSPLANDMAADVRFVQRRKKITHLGDEAERHSFKFSLCWFKMSIYNCVQFAKVTKWFNVQHKAHFSDLVSWVSICPSINDKSFSRLLGIAILSWTVSTLWQHPGWFSTDKGTFSGLENDDKKLSLVQSSEQHCVTPQIWSPIHCQQGSL